MRWRFSPMLRQIAERHLQRHLDRGRPAIGKEYVREARRGDVDQAARQHLGWLVRETGEDDLVQPARLCSMAATIRG